MLGQKGKTMTEYIVQIEDSEKNMSERFVGQLRSYPELIRCKECKHFLKARNENEYDSCSILFEMQIIPLETDENKYCAWAERRTNCDE